MPDTSLIHVQISISRSSYELLSQYETHCVSYKKHSISEIIEEMITFSAPALQQVIDFHKNSKND